MEDKKNIKSINNFDINLIKSQINLLFIKYVNINRFLSLRRYWIYVFTLNSPKIGMNCFNPSLEMTQSHRQLSYRSRIAFGTSTKS